MRTQNWHVSQIQCCQMFFSEPAPPTLKPAQFASPTNSKNLNSKTSPIFHQNSLKFRTFFGKSRKNVHPAQPAPSPSKILPAPQTLKTAHGAGNSPIWQHCIQVLAESAISSIISDLRNLSKQKHKCLVRECDHEKLCCPIDGASCEYLYVIWPWCRWRQ